MENDAGARLISPEKRKCRYTDENFLQVYRHYSYSACTVQCRKEAQLRLCNCTNYFMPNVQEHLKCNVSGIMCLNSHIQELSVSSSRIKFGKNKKYFIAKLTFLSHQISRSVESFHRSFKVQRKMLFIFIRICLKWFIPTKTGAQSSLVISRRFIL